MAFATGRHMRHERFNRAYEPDHVVGLVRLVYHVGELIDGYRRLGSLAGSPRHIIPGHDPLVIQRYPAVSDALRGIAVRLDLDPTA